MSYEKTIADLLALADRIDHEELWRRPGMEHRDWPQEKQDQLMAGVNLRRYASKLQEKQDAAAPGRVYMRGFKLERVSGNYPRDRGCGDHEWHAAINRFANDETHFPKPNDGRSKDWPRMMYTAKQVSDEVPRMILLFEQERRGLPTSYKMCGHDPSPATPLPDNHLRCHLGKQCRQCPYLQAIEAAPDMTNEAKDEAKAWTCATHILLESKPDTYFEGFLHDKSDDAFHARMARSFMEAEPPEPPLSPSDDDGVSVARSQPSAPSPTDGGAE